MEGASVTRIRQLWSAYVAELGAVGPATAPVADLRREIIWRIRGEVQELNASPQVKVHMAAVCKTAVSRHRTWACSSEPTRLQNEPICVSQPIYIGNQMPVQIRRILRLPGIRGSTERDCPGYARHLRQERPIPPSGIGQ
jgi:hypothetical protein